MDCSIAKKNITIDILMNASITSKFYGVSEYINNKTKTCLKVAKKLVFRRTMPKILLKSWFYEYFPQIRMEIENPMVALAVKHHAVVGLL